MKLYTIWKTKGMPFGIHEKCLMTDKGDYIGQDTGNLYSKDEHHHSEQINAKIASVDKENLTGMYHLYREWESHTEENRYSFKIKYIGCYVTVEEAHYAGDLKIYRCNELEEYFSENEVEIL